MNRSRGDVWVGALAGLALWLSVIVIPAPTANAESVNPQAEDVLAFGDAGFAGSTGGSTLNAPVVGMAPTPSGQGYWQVTADGGVFAFGDAQFFGSAGNLRLNKPIVGMAGAASGNGYWLVASDGGIFSYGPDAPFRGSTGAIKLNRPIVGVAADRDGSGYWLAAADGGVFAFDASFHGSTGNIRLNQPIVGMATDPDKVGYWMVASDGGVFAFEAPFYGSTGDIRLNQPIVGIASGAVGQGYWLAATDGGVFSFAVPFHGSAAGIGLNGKSVVAIAAKVSGSGYWMALRDTAARRSPSRQVPTQPGVLVLLGQLPIDNTASRAGYSRDLFPTWLDLDGNGCGARADVLVAESLVPATVDPAGACTVRSGEWISIYDGVRTTDAGSLDVDHMVPLAEAWRAGAFAWDAPRRAAFANDLNYPDQLIAVTASTNRSKGDRPPSEWQPPRQEIWCRYATAWVTVKLNWSLTATTAERDALGQMLETC